MRFRFRYSLRFFFCCCLLIGLGCGWFGYYLQQARKQAAAIATLQQSWDCLVTYDYAYEGPVVQPVPMWSSPCWSQQESSYPAWLIDWLGVDFFHHVKSLYLSPPLAGNDPFGTPSPPAVPFDQWQVLRNFPHLQEIHLIHYSGAQAPVADGFFAAIDAEPELEKLELRYAPLNQQQLSLMKNHSALRFLDFNHCEYEPDALPGLGTLPRLETLHCSTFHSPIEEARFGLPDCPKLRVLNLSKAPCNPQTMRALSQFKQLETLYLDDFEVTSTTIAALQQLPHLKRLSLRGIKCLSDDEIHRIVRAIPNMVVLDLGETNAEEKALEASAAQKKLDVVNFHLSRAEREHLLAAFCKVRPDLLVYWDLHGAMTLDWMEHYDPDDEFQKAFRPEGNLSLEIDP